LRHAAMNTPHLYRFIVIGLLTGSRSGAIFNLQWDWIDFKPEHAQASAWRGPGREEADPASPYRPRPTAALAALEAAGRWGLALRRALQRPAGLPDQADLGKACKAAKLKGVSPHTLRHTRATWLMQAGIDIWEAAGALGMTPAMLQNVYGKHHPDFQKRAAEV
jgi:integrase